MQLLPKFPRDWTRGLVLGLLLLVGEHAVAKEPLVVGLTGKYPPFNFFDESGKLTGFDVDVAREICRRLDRPCEFRPLQWDGILSALLARRIDVIIGSMAVTPARAKQVNFSVPYYESGAQLFVTPGGPSPRSDGFRVGVTLGTTYGEFARQQFPKAEVRTFKGDVEILQDVMNSRLDGIVTDKLVGLYMNESMGAGLRTEGEPLFLEKMAIPVHPDERELLQRINQAVTSIRSSSLYDEMLAKYFGDQARKAAPFSWPHAIGLLFSALWATIKVSFSGIGLGIVLAAFLAIGIVGLPKALSLVLVGVVDFIRSTPFMVQLFVLYFGLPSIGVDMGPWQAAVLAIALHSGAYLAEILKTAYQSVPGGQRQAARVLGLSQAQSLRFVVWPQMVPLMVAPFLNTIVAMIKDSAIVSVISVHELTMQAQQLISSTFRPMEFYLLAAILYALVTYPLLLAGRRLERVFIRKGLLSG